MVSAYYEGLVQFQLLPPHCHVCGKEVVRLLCVHSEARRGWDLIALCHGATEKAFLSERAAIAHLNSHQRFLTGVAFAREPSWPLRGNPEESTRDPGRDGAAPSDPSLRHP
jgi:hypothetical protein